MAVNHARVVCPGCVAAGVAVDVVALDVAAAAATRAAGGPVVAVAAGAQEAADSSAAQIRAAAVFSERDPHASADLDGPAKMRSLAEPNVQSNGLEPLVPKLTQVWMICSATTERSH